MSKGKLDAIVTMRSICLICAAESSSIVAVWGQGEMSVLICDSFLLTRKTKQKKDFQLKHPPRWRTWWGKWSHWCAWFCWGVEKKRGGEMKRSEKTSGSTCGSNVNDVATAKWVGVQQNLREAWDSLQDDIELSSLTGTNRNPCSLKIIRKDDLYIQKHKKNVFASINTLINQPV